MLSHQGKEAEVPVHCCVFGQNQQVGWRVSTPVEGLQAGNDFDCRCCRSCYKGRAFCGARHCGTAAVSVPSQMVCLRASHCALVSLCRIVLPRMLLAVWASETDVATSLASAGAQMGVVSCCRPFCTILGSGGTADATALRICASAVLLYAAFCLCSLVLGLDAVGSKFNTCALVLSSLRLFLALGLGNTVSRIEVYIRAGLLI